MFNHFKNRPFFQILFEAPADGGAGGAGKPAAAPAPATDEIIKGLQNLINRQGGESEALKLLYNDNHALRETNRELKAKVPGEGAVVLTGDSAKAWNEYQTLGKPDELKTKITEHQALQSEVNGYRKVETINNVAAVSGYNAQALRQLGQNLDYNIKEVTVDNKTVKQAFVKVGDAETPLDQYAQANWATFMPVLKSGAAASNQGNGGNGAGKTVQFANPTTPPGSQGNGGTGGADPVDSRLQAAQDRKAKAGNPFQPRSVTTNP